MDLSVIIVNFNTKDQLRKCLRAVFGSQTKYSFEVFVVDNASTDGSGEMVAGEFPKVKLITNKENVGFAKANNQVLRMITPHLNPLPQGERKEEGAWGGGDAVKYILLLNSDVEVMADTFDKMISFMDNDNTVGISSARVEKPDGSLDLASRRSFPNPINAFFRLSGLSFLFPHSKWSSYNLTYLPEDQITEVDSVMGAFLLIRSDLVKKIGYLDEDFFMYGEDLDWCYRAKAAGAKVMFVPTAKVTHDKGSSSRKVPKRMIYEFHRAMKIYYDKHYRLKYNPVFNFLVGLGIWTRYFLKLVENAFRREKYVSK